MVVTRVGIVVEGYMFEADIILSRSITPDDRGRVRMMLKVSINMASFPCLFRRSDIWHKFSKSEETDPAGSRRMQIVKKAYLKNGFGY